MLERELLLVGYSGHAYVACDIFLSSHRVPVAYLDNEMKVNNPYQLEYLGNEYDDNVIKVLKGKNYFVAIGDNKIRKKVTEFIQKETFKKPDNAIHKNSSISLTSIIGQGVMVGNGAIINACSIIGDGVICNTQSVIEHECQIGAFCHIGPCAVLCGNVIVGENSFIGARSVVKEGVSIGDNVVIGAGTVVINDIPSNSKVVGNPHKYL